MRITQVAQDSCGHCGRPTDPYSYQYVGYTLRQRFHPPCYLANRDAILRSAGQDPASVQLQYDSRREANSTVQ